MSLQDDYFELEASLKGKNKERMQRIWEYFCEIEREHEKLSEIVSSMRKSIRLMFEDEWNDKSTNST